MCNRVNLNVGGKIFSTTPQTLLIAGEECYFANLLRYWLLLAGFYFGSNKYNNKHGEEYFIDRSPESFMYILNYLRGYTIQKENISIDLLWLIDDCKFYGISDLERYLTHSAIQYYENANIENIHFKTVTEKHVKNGNSIWCSALDEPFIIQIPCFAIRFINKDPEEEKYTIWLNVTNDTKFIQFIQAIDNKIMANIITVCKGEYIEAKWNEETEKALVKDRLLSPLITNHYGTFFKIHLPANIMFNFESKKISVDELRQLKSKDNILIMTSILELSNIWVNNRMYGAKWKLNTANISLANTIHHQPSVSFE
jgi:hypothetical protein